MNRLLGTSAGLLTIAATAILAMTPAGCDPEQERETMTHQHGNTAAQAAPMAASKPEAKATVDSHPSATFAAGCFWGVEAKFRSIPGVVATAVGYTGGAVDNPTYEMVCSDATGHAEAVKVWYDPEKVTYEQLLDVFWANHDPTTPNRQGPDFGSQYRSAIFYETPAQKTAAEASRDALEASGRFRRPIVTQVVPGDTFWMAEEYHQQYLEKRGQASCHF